MVIVRVLLVGVFLPGILWAQLTTGVVEGTLRSPDGRPLAGTVLTVTGDPGFQTEVRSRGDGGFAPETLWHGKLEVVQVIT